MKKVLADIFNDNIYSSKLSKYVNYFIIMLIILSLVELILATEPSLEKYDEYFNAIYLVTSVIFLIEIILRFALAGYNNPKYRGFKGKLRFIVNFYNMIDIVAVLPFILSFFGFNQLIYLKAIRVLRILKIMRYLPSVDLLVDSVTSKKNELLISFQVISLSAVLVSFALYYAESSVPGSQFDSITSAMLWSVAKFIGDIAGYGDFSPVTTFGMILGTLNGVLGIAIFALPAGIIASGFVEKIAEQNKLAEINERTDKIIELYIPTKSYHLNNRYAKPRFFTIEALQSKLLHGKDQILESLRHTQKLRYRAVKSSDDVNYSDMAIIEHAHLNRSYGAKFVVEKSRLTFVCPVGKAERSSSHFTTTIAENLGCSYIIKELRLIGKDGIIMADNKSKHYLNIGSIDYEEPQQIQDYLSDLAEIDKDSVVIIVSAGASNRGDIVVEYGNPAGQQEYIEGVSTLHNKDLLEKLKFAFTSKASNFSSKVRRSKSEDFNFSIEFQGIGNDDEKWIGKSICRHTGANVLTLYINIRYLQDEVAPYYAIMNYLFKVFEEVFIKDTPKEPMSS